MGAWYKEWYLTTPAAEQQLRDALNDPDHGAENRADVQKRLNEMLQLHPDRCAISVDQSKFLQKVLNG